MAEKKADSSTPASSSVPVDDDAEFSRLFLAARREHTRLKKKATGSEPAHQAALAFARARGWDWGEKLIEVSLLTKTGKVQEAGEVLAGLADQVPLRHQGLRAFIEGNLWREKGEMEAAIATYRRALADPYFDWHGAVWNSLGVALATKGNVDEAIEAFQKALVDPNNDTPGLAWYNLGIALADKGWQDEAIEAYQKALADPGYDTPGNAWNNLGIVCRKKGNVDDAIEAYQKALAEPSFDNPSYAWNNLGAALADKGRVDEAIEAYQKALADPRYDTSARTWNNLGAALADKGRLDEAIEAYQKALADPRYDTPARTWNNLGFTYAQAERVEDARNAYEQVLDCVDVDGAQHSRAKLGLQQLQARMAPAALSPDDRALTASAVATASTKADSTTADPATPGAPGKAEDLENQLVTAIREAGDTQYDKYAERPAASKREDTLSILRGWSSAVTLLEGSERRWRGGGYFLKWRGHGMVIDPGFDFLRNFHDAGYHGREIDAVVVSHNHPDHNYDLKPIDDLRYELYGRLANTGKPGGRPYVLLWDEDTRDATQFGMEKPEHHRPPVVFSSDYPVLLDLNKPPFDFNLPLRISPFKVQHSKDVPNAMGMVIELLNEDGGTAFRLGYTADTAYFPELAVKLAGCDVLIAHISQPSIEELQNPAVLKKVHLGYRGTAQLLQNCTPRLALIGEFWAGFTDLRIPLVKGLRKLSGLPHILPAGLSMHLRLPSLEIECTECGKPVDFQHVKTAPPADAFGSLAYLCPGCLLG